MQIYQQRIAKIFTAVLGSVQRWTHKRLINFFLVSKVAQLNLTRTKILNCGRLLL